MVIDSASNKKIKLMESLRLRKHREREGLFRIEGVLLAEMAAEWPLHGGAIGKGARPPAAGRPPGALSAL